MTRAALRRGTPVRWSGKSLGRGVCVRACLLLAAAAFGAGCGSAATSSSRGTAGVRVVFVDGQAYAEQARQRWRIAEVPKEEMVWAPDGVRFAYVLRRPEGRHYVIIRNSRGDSVNAFPVYRPGKPLALDWLDDNQLAYVAPRDQSGKAYVVHSARDGRVLAVYRGSRFAWSPGRQRLAYVSRGEHQQVRVGHRRVWPRASAGQRGRIVSELFWSPDGSGLAFLESSGAGTRLVVLLVIDDPAGDLTWRLPAAAGDPRNKLFWAASKLLIGESTFKPRYAASWNRLH
ncbi:MAG: PD40 domain-containing protein [Deltaproteobacteria bacterium]|nr:PD40 domain-containing protein [Deltaproteobacteria bacterium]